VAQITVNSIVTVLFEQGRDAMTERVTAWQCIGCGRIEGAQPCVGICQDRKTDFVYASDHDEVLAQLALARQRAEALAALVRQLACTTPRKDEWERTYRALQARARQTLGTLANDEQPKPG
jgi:hypothetical protein